MKGELLILTAVWPTPRFPYAGCFIRNLTSSLMERGQQCKVVAPAGDLSSRPLPGQGKSSDHVRSFKGELYGFPNPAGRPKLTGPSPLLGALYLFSAFRTCLKASKRSNPGAVLVHWVLPTGPAGLAVSKFLNIPLFLWVHGSDLEVYARGSALFSRMARSVLTRARKVFAVSESLSEKARALGAPGSVLLSMGVDPTFKTKLSEKQKGPPFRVLFIGDLIPGKGVRAALNARKLLGPARNVVFTFAGRGPLEKEIRSNGGSVSSPVGASGVVGLLDEADVLILPSRSEGTPLSVLEALSRGVPVIATRVGGIPGWIREGREGLLLSPPPRASRLARAIAALYDSPDRLQRLKAGAEVRGRQVPTSEEVAARFLAEIQKES